MDAGFRQPARNRLYTGSPDNPDTPQGLLTGLQEMGDSVEEPSRLAGSRQRST